MCRSGTLEDVAGAMDVLKYDRLTGHFFWRVARNSHGGKVVPGQRAGTSKDGYVQIIVNQVIWRAHRLAWAHSTGELPSHGFEIDHINGDRADNRLSNLRVVSRTQNNLNLGISKRNVSGCKGVSWIAKTQKWMARLKADGKIIHLGVFQDKSDAIRARREGEKRYHGEYARAA